MFKKEKQKDSITFSVQEVKLRALKIHNLVVPTKAINREPKTNTTSLSLSHHFGKRKHYKVV